MDVTSKLFAPLVVLLALSLVAMSGCSDPQKAIERVKGETNAAEPPNIQTLLRNPEALTKEVSEAKEKLGAISLSGCPRDFKSAFNDWRKNIIEVLDLTIELSNIVQSGDRNVAISKQQELEAKIKQGQQAEAKLREVERKYASK